LGFLADFCRKKSAGFFGGLPGSRLRDVDLYGMIISAVDSRNVQEVFE